MQEIPTGDVTNYLDTDAAETFYMLSVISFECENISGKAFAERMTCLVSMLNPKSLAVEDLKEYLSDVPSEETETINDVDGEVHIERVAHSRDVPATAEETQHHEDPYLYLCVGSVAGMKVWKFHKFDADPTPSIPHGHHEDGEHKCDPYNGRVYNRDRKEIIQKRLTKKTRKALWQDKDFREFALKAIIWYEKSYSHFRFRVCHPYRLPRF